MASLVKRKSKWAVVYSIEDSEGKKHQKWETFASKADAKRRKLQIEHEKAENTFSVPSANTVHDLLNEYVSVYGVNTWSASTYDSKRALIDNYIIPVIGDVKLCDLTPRMMNAYYQNLLTMKSVVSKYRKGSGGNLSARTVREIHKILRSAFNQAVRWEMIPRNPVINCILPKVEENRRNIWDADTLFHAIEICEDAILQLALHLAFSCSLRMGEMLGLTWDCVDIEESSITANRAYIFVNKELQRITKDAMDALDGKGVIMTFPAFFAKNRTILVLKEPKTKTSVRKVFLPKTVARLLQEHKKQQEEYKMFFGDEYHDYNLVFCNEVGRPLEGSRINRAMSELIEKNDLPKVCFHSIRHTSTTYKLKLTGGDIKAVQGDTGHNTTQMVTERYAHILDDDRRRNAELIEEAFYRTGDTAEENQHVEESDSENVQILKMLEQSPEMLQLIKAMLLKQNAG